MQLIRTRKSTTKPTLGTIAVIDGSKTILEVECLELPWKGNKNNISCIPEGVYPARKRYTKKRGWHFHITDVPGRTWILIHIANYAREIRGCIIPGLKHADIDGDGVMDIASSTQALKMLLGAVPHEGYFLIDVL